MSNPVDLSVSPYHTPNTITDRMIVALEQTRPHVRVVSVLGFITSILMLAAAGFVLFAGAFLPELASLGKGAVFAALAYLVMAVMYFIPSLLLAQYGRQIGEIRESSDRVPPIESALELQRSFWRFVGVLASISVLVMLVALVAGVLGVIYFARTAG